MIYIICSSSRYIYVLVYMYPYMYVLMCLFFFSFRVPATSNKSDRDRWFQVSRHGNEKWAEFIIQHACICKPGIIMGVVCVARQSNEVSMQGPMKEEEQKQVSN